MMHVPNVLTQIYLDIQEKYEGVWGKNRKQIDGRKQMFVEHVLKMAEFNLKILSGEYLCRFKYVTEFSDMVRWLTSFW